MWISLPWQSSQLAYQSKSWLSFRFFMAIFNLEAAFALYCVLGWYLPPIYPTKEYQSWNIDIYIFIDKEFYTRFDTVFRICQCIVWWRRQLLWWSTMWGESSFIAFLHISLPTCKYIVHEVACTLRRVGDWVRCGNGKRLLRALESPKTLSTYHVPVVIWISWKKSRTNVCCNQFTTTVPVDVF